ncbi:MAG: serine/threonine protein kinase [Rubrivivax sp.]|nr:serine/threonine protein kinase [Rubrivivax sp.]
MPRTGPPADDAPPPDWAAVRRLFEAAQEHPAGERAAFVQGADAPEAVRREAASLLDHTPAGDDFLADAQPGRSGERCGAWQLMGLLGRGGMGDVYDARRVDGAFDGRAAVKLLRRGLDSAQVLRRFAAERQALARLNHPHIARLLDAGLTADGLPFFVMEQVQGRPIDQAAAGLPLEARLQLFLQLADAVAHAHRNLLVHRDLKPGNVLVDADGQVKLLDFGIAKALDPLDPADPADGADGSATLAGERPFTPQFASPEQVRGEPVGTATDVYSLGVLLYLLLTGQRPYGRSATTAHAAARCVLEEEPTRPRLLAPGLRGDLDNILMKALQKAPERRYGSVDALAADVRAHLAGRPVSARRQSSAYLLSRFVVRNRVASATAALGLLALVAGLGLALWQVQALEQANQRAERRFAQVRQLAQGIVFRYHDQIAHLPGSIPVREALLQDASRYLDGLLAEGTPEPGLAREVAETYQRIAILQGEQFSPSQERMADAARNLDKALALQPLYLAARAPAAVPLAALNNAADMWLSRATLHIRSAALQPGWQALEQARVLVERAVALAPDDLQTVSRLATLEGRIGLLLGANAADANLGRLAEGLAMLVRAEQRMAGLVRREPANPEWVHQWAWSCQLLARGMSLANRPADAITWGERAVALRDRALAALPGNTHFRHQTATARMALSSSASIAGDHARALALHEEADALMRGIVRDDPGNKAAERDARVLPLVHAQLLVRAGREAQARPLLLQALAALPPVAQDFYLQRIHADALIWAARAWLPAEPARAEDFARQAAQLMQPAETDDNAARWWSYAQALGLQAAAAAAQGAPGPATALARSALSAWQRSSPGGAAPGYFEPDMQRSRRLAGTPPT